MHFLNWHFHSKMVNGELADVFFNLALKNFALSMIGVFVPIYLLTLGFELSQVLMYVLAFFSGSMLISFFIGSIIAKIGLKHTIAFSMPISLSYILFLYLLPRYQLPILPIALLGGIALSAYWIPFNTDFIRNSNEKFRAEETGMLFGIARLAIVIGPLIGAAILNFYDFNVLFGVVIACLIVAALPMLLGADLKDVINFNPKTILAPNHRQYVLRFIFQGAAHTGEWVIWPLFIYLMAESILNVGGAASLTSLAAVLFAFAIGKSSHLISKTALIKIGALLYAGLWFVRQLANIPSEIFLVSFFAGLFSSLIEIPLFTKAADDAVKENALEFMILREISLGIGEIGFLFVTIFGTSALAQTFNISAIASLGLALIG